MSIPRTLRHGAAGLVVLLTLASLSFLVVEPGGLDVDSPFGAKLAEGLTLGSIFLTTLLTGPLLLVCGGALLWGGSRGTMPPEQRREWRLVFLLWSVGLLVPRLLVLLPFRHFGDDLWTHAAPFVAAALVVLAIVLAVKKRRGVAASLVVAGALLFPYPTLMMSFGKASGLLPGASWMAVGLLLATALATGRPRRWLLHIGLSLALLGTARAWRTHAGYAVATVEITMVAAWLIHRRVKTMKLDGLHPATRLGLTMAPLTLLTSWLGLLALGGDNCLLLAYLQGLGDPAVDFGVCTGLFPDLMWDLNRGYRGLLALGALPAAGLLLHWLSPSHPRRRWALVVACTLSVLVLQLTVIRGMSRHFGGIATMAVARASAETKNTMLAAGTGLYDYVGRQGHWEYGPLFDPEEYGQSGELMEIPARFAELLLQKPDESPGPRARSWFPETLLFEPIVVTDAEGLATLEVPVPDQLTRWRLLALAHSRSGRQAGAEASFVSTLPIAIELVEPPMLRQGDRAQLPVRVVNNGEGPWSGTLWAQLSGAARGALDQPLELAAHSSVVRFLEVRATEAGVARLTVDIGADRTEHRLVVQHSGRLARSTRGGTLGAAREFEIETPKGAKAGSSAVAVTVFPGPMGFLEKESQRRLPGDLEGAAYALALTGRGQLIAARLGVQPDLNEARDARVRARLELDRQLHRQDALEAVVAMSAIAPRVDSTVAALADRFILALESEQLLDGSYPLQQASLERSLVMAAEAARVARDHSPLVAVRAAGFLERHAPRVRDPYTAAVLAASGGVVEPQLGALRNIVRDAVEPQDDGSAQVEPGPLSVRIDGRQPGVVETTAQAVLALADDPASHDLVADLGAALLGSYDPGRGFGDGIASMAVLDALDRFFQQPLPQRVQLALSIDGEPVLERTHELGAGFDPLRLEALLPDGPGLHRVILEAHPHTPGLAYSLEHSAWLPWSRADEGAFAVRVESPSQATVGRPFTCRVHASIPAGEPFEIVLELPAGVELGELRESTGDPVKLNGRQGIVRFTAVPRDEGQGFSADLDLIPTIAGSLRWGAATLALTEAEQQTSAPVGILEVALAP